METAANRIIDAMGGTSAVARRTETPPSTVHSWRRNGIPRSRLAHLRLVGQELDPPVDVDAIISATDAAPSSGKAQAVSAEAAR